MTARQRMWNVLRAAEKPLKATELAVLAKAGIDDTRYFLRWTERAGFVRSLPSKDKRIRGFRYVKGGINNPLVTRCGNHVVVIDVENNTIWRENENKD